MKTESNDKPGTWLSKLTSNQRTCTFMLEPVPLTLGTETSTLQSSLHCIIHNVWLESSELLRTSCVISRRDDQSLNARGVLAGKFSTNMTRTFPRKKYMKTNKLKNPNLLSSTRYYVRVYDMWGELREKKGVEVTLAAQTRRGEAISRRGSSIASSKYCWCSFSWYIHLQERTKKKRHETAQRALNEAARKCSSKDDRGKVLAGVFTHELTGNELWFTG